MTTTCSSTTATPFQGEVALGYWQTLYRALALEGLANAEDQQSTDFESTPSVTQYLDALRTGFSVRQGFGLVVGSLVSLQTFPVLGMTLLSCDNLRQAMQQILRYESLNHDLGSSNLTIGENVSQYSWTPNPTYLTKTDDVLSFQLSLSVFAGIKTFAPMLVQAGIPFKKISFVAPEPQNSLLYRDFFETDVLFNQKLNAITVDNETLDWKVRSGDPSILRTLTSHADELLLPGESEQDYSWKVKSILPDALRQQAFGIEDLANKLNISPRTLQRRLKELGYSYQTIVNETRQKLAEIYLSENKVSMNEIAFLIGYREQSSFNHAFKSWTGLSPSEYQLTITTNEK